MNNTIQKKMIDFKKENRAKQTWFTAEEWSESLGMQITPQRFGSMYRAGLIDRDKNKKYYGDNRYRYDVKVDLSTLEE